MLSELSHNFKRRDRLSRRKTKQSKNWENSLPTKMTKEKKLRGALQSKRMIPDKNLHIKKTKSAGNEINKGKYKKTLHITFYCLKT